MTPEFGVNPTGFFVAKFISWLVFWFVLKVVFVIGSAVDRLCGRFRDSLVKLLAIVVSKTEKYTLTIVVW